MKKYSDLYRETRKALLPIDGPNQAGVTARELLQLASGKTAAELLLRLKAQMRKYNTKTILVPGRGDHSYAEHEAILRAVQNRDAAAAEACMRRHVENVRGTFGENFSILF